MKGWKDTCGPLDQYGMKYSRLFANLCNAGISVEQMSESASNACNQSSETFLIS